MTPETPSPSVTTVGERQAIAEGLCHDCGRTREQHANLETRHPLCDTFVALTANAPVADQPIDMLLFCPKCGRQHVDDEEHALVWTGGSVPEPSHDEVVWDNPPHRSHLCHACGCIWRPADVATNGVKKIRTIGSADTWSTIIAPAFPVTPTADAPVSDRPLVSGRPSWTCFHCGEVFTTPGAARNHFGFEPSADPACCIKIGAERGLVMALRKAEAELAEYVTLLHDENLEAYRLLARAQSRHVDSLQTAEEAGYERGLADGRAEAQAALPPHSDIEGLREAVEAEREACAQLADKWRDENKAAVAKARKRAGLMGDDGMADMLDGAAIECNAIGQAIRARTVLGGL